MDDQRVGHIVRALLRRLGWRQADLGHRAGWSQGMASLVERGHLDRVSIRIVRRILAALDASLVLDVRWRGGALDRLLDEDHARLLGIVADRLRSLWWDVRTEVTYSEFGERGSYDILAWHAATATLLIIEIKTELTSLEATLRKIDDPETSRRRQSPWYAQGLQSSGDAGDGGGALERTTSVGVIVSQSPSRSSPLE